MKNKQKITKQFNQLINQFNQETNERKREKLMERIGEISWKASHA